MKIAKDSLVAMNYRLFDGDGLLVESTDEEGPVEYRHGHQEILPGLETALEGAEVGANLRVTVAPEDGYGPYNPEGLVPVPRKELPDHHDLEPGDRITVTVEAEEGDAEELDPHEREMEMRVVEVRAEEVVLDANHPLAGQEITFEVEIVSIS